MFVTRREHHLVFDQAFHVFSAQAPDAGEDARHALAERPGAAGAQGPPPLKRVEDAFFAGVGEPRTEEKPRIEVETRLAVSTEEVFRTKDFAQMSAEEIIEARRRIALLRCRTSGSPTRRLIADRSGKRLDLRATLRASLRSGGELVDLHRRGPGERRPPLVALLDISGSMADYSRLVLQFLHALTAQRRRVSTFLFGTRLTNVSRALAHRDPDEALALAGDERAGLVRRHPHRLLAARLQPLLVAPGAGAGRGGAAHHRWAGA